MRMATEIDPREATSIEEEAPSVPADEPPPDVLRAAEKIGAFSAGPAPVRLALEANVRRLRDAPLQSAASAHERAGPSPAAGAARRGSRKKAKRS